VSNGIRVGAKDHIGTWHLLFNYVGLEEHGCECEVPSKLPREHVGDLILTEETCRYQPHLNLILGHRFGVPEV
jgi:hypothetical protein